MNELDLAERVRTAFDRIGLVATDLAVLAPLPIHASTKRFLSEVGLPAAEMFGFSFHPVRDLPAVRDHSWAVDDLSGWVAEVRCLAENFGQVIGIDLARGGSVHWIDLTGGERPMFVNSRTESFGGFLAECTLHGQRLAAGSDRERSVAECRARMLALDPPALDAATGYWPTVLKELELGLS